MTQVTFVGAESQGEVMRSVSLGERGAEKTAWAAPQAHAGTGLFWENGKSSGGKLAGG